MQFLWVFLGGGLGSLARYGIANALAKQGGVFPWATLVANFLACVLLGALSAYGGKQGMAESTRLMLMVGFCGGFSTFSTFSGETFRLLEAGHWAYAMLNVLASVSVCLVGIYCGMRFFR